MFATQTWLTLLLDLTLISVLKGKPLLCRGVCLAHKAHRPSVLTHAQTWELVLGRATQTQNLVDTWEDSMLYKARLWGLMPWDPSQTDLLALIYASLPMPIYLFLYSTLSYLNLSTIYRMWQHTHLTKMETEAQGYLIMDLNSTAWAFNHYTKLLKLLISPQQTFDSET